MREHIMHNKIVLVTGGSRGLGRSMALHLAKGGMDLILTYHRQQAEAKAVAEQARALGVRVAVLQLDVGDSSQFAAFAQTVQQTLQQGWQRTQLDALINNAGTGLHAAFADTSEAQFDEVYRIHLKAPYFLTQALLPLLTDGSRILNISSGLARFSLPGSSAYAMMKGGIEVMSRYLAKELGPRGISVNTLAPGAIETDFSGGLVRDNPEINRFVASQTALGRVGLPDDIGALVALLLADGGHWITGQRIEASGGMFL